MKGNRALAVAYIDARTVQDRLDDVLGPENWEDHYEIGPGGAVKCKLTLKLGAEWVSKEDVGSPSEQPDAGDKMKAAFSDALKRAAVKWGIGRYLYRLPAVWCDYDPATRHFRDRPRLPDWAVPKTTTDGRTGEDIPAAATKREKPKTGAELKERMRQFESELFTKGLCKAGELIQHVQRMCKAAKWPEDVTKLNADGIEFAIELVKAFVEERTAKAAEQAKPASPPPPAIPAPTGANRPNAATLTVREEALKELRGKADEFKRTFGEDFDKWADRTVHAGLTMSQLETLKADGEFVWEAEAISQIAQQLEEFMSEGVAH